jgi:two-component system, OmpR family, phosphate regulon response regulator PhoB
MALILVVEDEPDLAKTLEYNLRREGHDTKHAATGTAALEFAFASPTPDLVLLDLMLPDIAGTEVCKQLRADPRTQSIAVIMLTAKDQEIDRVVGFELGADDYVAKPFSTRELMLRVKAILRRGASPPSSSSASPSGETTFGTLRIDKDGYGVWVSGAEITLTALEFRLLVLLVERRGRVQTREGLLSDVWGIDADVTTRTVDTHVKRLRQKLGTAGAYIETLRGVGYRCRATPDEAGPGPGSGSGQGSETGPGSGTEAGH